MAGIKQNLVTMAEARGALRIDGNDHDPRISLLIAAASQKVLQFITEDTSAWFDGNGEAIPGVVPADVKTATLIELMALDHNAETNEGEMFEREFLPHPVESLLLFRRKPTLA